MPPAIMALRFHDQVHDEAVVPGIDAAGEGMAVPEVERRLQRERGEHRKAILDAGYKIDMEPNLPASLIQEPWPEIIRLKKGMVELIQNH